MRKAAEEITPSEAVVAVSNLRVTINDRWLHFALLITHKQNPQV